MLATLSAAAAAVVVERERAAHSSNDGIQLKSPCVSNGVSFQMGLTLMAFLLMILVYQRPGKVGSKKCSSQSGKKRVEMIFHHHRC